MTAAGLQLITAASGDATSYSVTATSKSGNKFTVSKAGATGLVSRSCTGTCTSW
jgi:hypothetical protein